MAQRTPVSRAEMEVLRYIQDHHPTTVREVAEYFGTQHGKAKTTVLTLMERLRQKGHLIREEVDGYFRYSPAEAKAEVQRALVHDFIQTVLGGSISPFTAYLSGQSNVSGAELDELKHLIAELEAQEREQAAREQAAREEEA